MNYSVIDIGSNTVKCEVFSYENNELRSIDFFTEQLGIIARIKYGLLSANDTCLLCDIITSYIEKAKKYNAKIYCFATESLRKINNLEWVKKAIFECCKIDIELISGEDEALLSFDGFKAECRDISDGLMIDMGGGSTEILLFKDREAQKLNSFKFGCLSLKKEFVMGRFPQKNETEQIKSYVKEQIEAFPWIKDTRRICLIGGTGTAIGKLAIEAGFTTIPEFPIKTFFELFNYLDTPGEKQIELLEKYIPARVETILPGMSAYRAIIETINAETVYISKDGIREGYIYRKINEE